MTSFQPVLGAFAVVLWPFAVIGLHELAHLVVGSAVGCRPRAVVIGTGPELFHIDLPIAKITVRLFPVKGHVSGHWRSQTGLWWRGSVFVLAGPGMDALILAALFRETGGGTFFAWVAPWNQFLGLAIVFQGWLLLSNLIPQDGFRDGRKVPNDGKQFLGYVTGQTGRTVSQLLSSYRTNVARYDPAFTLEQPWLFKGDSADLTLFIAAEEHYAKGEFEAAVETYRRVLSTHPMSPGERALALDQLACIAVMSGAKRFLTEAVEWAREAHALLPRARTIQGTFGSLLVETGKHAEGIALLEPLTSADNEPTDRAMAACYLAKACHHLGEVQRSAHWLALATEVDACPAVYTRIQAEITAGGGCDRLSRNNSAES